MRFAILAAFVDADMRVVRIRRMPPARLALPRPRVQHVLELPVDAPVVAGEVFRDAGP